LIKRMFDGSDRHGGSTGSAALRGLLASAMLGAAIMVSASARAEEPKGCDGFKWSLKHEAELLQAPARPVVASGADAAVDGKAYDLKLVDFEHAGLPTPPERKPKMTPSMAGFVRYAAPTAGAYQVTISQAAWIDVVQDGHMIKPSAFSGAQDCPGVRKSIRLTLAATPFTIQISGMPEASIGLVVAPIP
jgi:hypothetical protein